MDQVFVILEIPQDKMEMVSKCIKYSRLIKACGVDIEMICLTNDETYGMTEERLSKSAGQDLVNAFLKEKNILTKCVVYDITNTGIDQIVATTNQNNRKIFGVSFETSNFLPTCTKIIEILAKLSAF